jgi:hypothetical protein
MTMAASARRQRPALLLQGHGAGDAAAQCAPGGLEAELLLAPPEAANRPAGARATAGARVRQHLCAHAL